MAATLLRSFALQAEEGFVPSPFAKQILVPNRSVAQTRSKKCKNLVGILRPVEDRWRVLKQLRRELHSIAATLQRRVRRCRAQPRTKARWQELAVAGQELLDSSDCTQQLLLCELGRLASIVLVMSKMYARDVGVGDGGSDAESSDAHSDACETSTA